MLLFYIIRFRAFFRRLIKWTFIFIIHAIQWGKPIRIFLVDQMKCHQKPDVMETIQTVLDDIINQIVQTTKRKRNDPHPTNKKQKTTHPLDGYLPHIQNLPHTVLRNVLYPFFNGKSIMSMQRVCRYFRHLSVITRENIIRNTSLPLEIDYDRDCEYVSSIVLAEGWEDRNLLQLESAMTETLRSQDLENSSDYRNLLRLRHLRGYKARILSTDFLEEEGEDYGSLNLPVNPLIGNDDIFEGWEVELEHGKPCSRKMVLNIVRNEIEEHWNEDVENTEAFQLHLWGLLTRTRSLFHVKISNNIIHEDFPQGNREEYFFIRTPNDGRRYQLTISIGYIHGI